MVNKLSDAETEMFNACFYTVDLSMLSFDGKRLKTAYRAQRLTSRDSDEMKVQ